MPFGPYGSFDECVQKNKGRVGDPEAYCAVIKRAIEGNSAKMSEAAQVVFYDALAKWDGYEYSLGEKFALEAVIKAGFQLRNGQYVKTNDNAMTLRTVKDVQIFAAGTHNGIEFPSRSVQSMISAFSELKGRLDPPLKIGHTSDEFNKMLAAKMGVPPELLTGEQGKGAMALGWVSNLRAKGNVLVADFMNVPEPIADLIESKSYQKVSSEVITDFKDQGKNYPYVLSAVALLGREQPAVRDIEGLAKVAIHTATPDGAVEIWFDEDGAKSFLRQVYDNIASFLKQGETKSSNEQIGAGATVGAAPAKGSETAGAQSKYTNEEEAMIAEFKKALGLAETAKDEEVLAAIQKLTADPFVQLKKTLGLADNAKPEDCMAAVKALQEKSQAPKEHTELQQRVVTLQAQLAVEQRARKVSDYTEFTTKLSAVAGTPKELAEEVVFFEEKDPVMGWQHACRLQELQDMAVRANITKPIGKPAEGDGSQKHEFQLEVDKLVASGQSETDAIATLSKSKPEIYRTWRKETAPLPLRVIESK